MSRFSAYIHNIIPRICSTSRSDNNGISIDARVGVHRALITNFAIKKKERDEEEGGEKERESKRGSMNTDDSKVLEVLLHKDK